MFMVANVAGIGLYLLLASRGWIAPREQEIPFTGEPFVWALALPVLGIFLIVDVLWGGLLLRDKESKRRLWWFVTSALWLVAIGIDFYHH
jgi:hypothetical protein